MRKLTNKHTNPPRLVLLFYTLSIDLQILLLTGDPKERPFLVHMANMITKRLSMLQCVNIVSEEVPFEVRNENIQKTQKWLGEHRIKAFYTVSKSDKLKEGAR